MTDDDEPFVEFDAEAAAITDEHVRRQFVAVMERVRREEAEEAAHFGPARWVAKAERLAGTWSPVLEGPVGMAECGCPNRIDGTAPVLHLCRTCGYEGSFASVHQRCAGCAYLAESRPSV